MLELNQIHQGDCLELMKLIPTGSIDMILCDLPYGTTACEWDSIIDMGKLWQEYERVIKDNGAIVLTSQGMFTAKLMVFREKWFNHDYIWVKNRNSNHALTGLQPHRIFENVLVFRPPRKDDIERKYNKDLRAYFTLVNEFIGLFREKISSVLGHTGYHHSYSVQGSQFALCTRETYEELINHFKIDQMEGFLSYDTLVSMNPPYTYNHGATIKREYTKTRNSMAYEMYGKEPKEKEYVSKEYENYPKNVLYYNVERGMHPTQKPVALFEYLIKTYTNEGEVVLDNCSGSGTTAIACINSNRQFICIEQNEEYIKRSRQRVLDHEPLLNLKSSP
jgi:DNA modification methylase